MRRGSVSPRSFMAGMSKNIMKKILKKKILMDFLIRKYSKWRMVFKYLKYSVAIISPLISTVNGTIDRVQVVEIISIVMTYTILFITGLEEIIGYDSKIEISKTQLTRYDSLLGRIERETNASGEKKQNIDDFNYWISRELAVIENTDPVLTYDDQVGFDAFCKKFNIPNDETLDMLKELIIDDTEEEKKDDKSFNYNIDKYDANSYRNNDIKKEKSRKNRRDMKLAIERLQNME
jgi:hypothetical protein